MKIKEILNIADLPKGEFRSIKGYADESLVIGVALLCGYNLFFKAWRDSSYDAVLDHQGELFRIEIKGTSTKSLSVTGGGRSGAQIADDAPNREKIVTKDVCDFLIGISVSEGDCYIIPTEVIQILNRKAPTLKTLSPFKNKWEVFLGIKRPKFVIRQIREGFSSLLVKDLKKLCQKHKIPLTKGANYPWVGVQGNSIAGLRNKEKLILDIWKFIYSKL